MPRFVSGNEGGARVRGDTLPLIEAFYVPLKADINKNRIKIDRLVLKSESLFSQDVALTAIEKLHNGVLIKLPGGRALASAGVERLGAVIPDV